jgi:hypothetical protein
VLSSVFPGLSSALTGKYEHGPRLVFNGEPRTFRIQWKTRPRIVKPRSPAKLGGRVRGRVSTLLMTESDARIEKKAPFMVTLMYL